MVGKRHHRTSLHTCADTQHQTLEHFSFPSLPGPVAGEMPSTARLAAVGVVGRPPLPLRPGCPL